jgi:RNA polymerase primary sigma factor
MRRLPETSPPDRPFPATMDGPPLVYTNGDLAHHTADAMDQFLADAAQHRLLTAVEEIALAKRIERGDLAAKERLIEHNVRLVVSVARRYHAAGSDMALLDLVQEGMLGLIRATEKYDWRKGFRFSTYATLWIRQAIGRALDQHARTIRLPSHVAQRERKVAAIRTELAARLGRDPSDEEIAEHAGLALTEVQELAGTTRVVTSLDRPLTEDGELTLADTVVAGGSDEVAEEVQLQLSREAVRRTVATLPEREREVIRLRFGLDEGGEPQTLAAIAKRIGVGPERVRQIEERALARLALRREMAALADAA